MKIDWRIDAVFGAILVALGSAASAQPVDSMQSKLVTALLIQFIGALFILSYYYPDRSHLLRWLMAACMYTSVPVRGPGMAIVWGTFAIGIGAIALVQAFVTGAR